MAKSAWLLVVVPRCLAAYHLLSPLLDTAAVGMPSRPCPQNAVTIQCGETKDSLRISCPLVPPDIRDAYLPNVAEEITPAQEV